MFLYHIALPYSSRSKQGAFPSGRQKVRSLTPPFSQGFSICAFRFFVSPGRSFSFFFPTGSMAPGTRLALPRSLSSSPFPVFSLRSACRSGRDSSPWRAPKTLTIDSLLSPSLISLSCKSPINVSFFGERGREPPPPHTTRWMRSSSTLVRRRKSPVHNVLVFFAPPTYSVIDDFSFFLFLGASSPFRFWVDEPLPSFTVEDQPVPIRLRPFVSRLDGPVSPNCLLRALP